MVLAVAAAHAQGRKTIILVRHAEKDVSATADPNDPDLSPDGKQRAERLWRVIKKYKPGALYSTDYRRTRDTLSEVARKRGLKVGIYDARRPDALLAEIGGSKTKRFLVVGHSNTIPGLANLLLKKELFKNLDDAEYGTIWIIRLREDEPPRTEVISY
jgi:broad specificity phosphatase PhoE